MKLDNADQTAIDASTTSAVQALKRLLEVGHFPSAQERLVREHLDRNPKDAALTWLPQDLRNKYINQREVSPAPKDQDLAFYLRFFIAATLPHGRPDGLEFSRQAGRAKVALHIPQSLSDDLNVGLPYGPLPRLILMWLAREVRRTGSPTIELGTSKSAFLKDLGITPSTGKRGSLKNLEYQLTALVSTYYTAWWRTGDEQTGSVQIQNATLSDHKRLWWDGAAAGTRRFGAVLELTPAFYNEMVDRSFPVDMSAVRELSGSSLAIDIYAWLTYRMSMLRRPLQLGWHEIYSQFGSGEYSVANTHRFKRRWVEALKHAQRVYPQARIAETDNGFILTPSRTSILPRQR